MDSYDKFGVENNYIQSAYKSGRQIKIILTNGYQMYGKITGYDLNVIKFETEDSILRVYKHAISSFVEPK